METCSVLLIDSLPEITILKESMNEESLPLTIQYISSVRDGLLAAEILQFDLLIVGSSLIIQGGFEQFRKISPIPIVILCESDGFSKFYNIETSRVCFINRPFELDEMPGVLTKAYNFWLSSHEEG